MAEVIRVGLGGRAYDIVIGSGVRERAAELDGRLFPVTDSRVEELYGDSKEEDWKKEEVARLKAEQGIAELEEPGVNQAAGSFQVNLKGGDVDEGQSGEAAVPDEPEGISGNAGAGQ